MAKNESILIISGIVAGVAVAGSLFLLYPDMMFKNTSFQAQQGGTPPVSGSSPTMTPPATNPQGTTTAGVGSNNSTNSTTGNTTAGASGSTSAQPPSY